MSTKQKFRLAIADNHSLFRQGLIQLINMSNLDFVITLEAAGGIELQKKLNKENEPEILLLDINLPDMDGLNLIIWVNQNFPTVKILVVSNIEKIETIHRLREIGVNGYLGKDVEPNELASALKIIRNNGTDYAVFLPTDFDRFDFRDFKWEQ